MGLALPYVENQTLEICMLAVKQYVVALKYVKDQTLEICIEAFKQDWHAFQYVKNKTPEICRLANKFKEKENSSASANTLNQLSL